MRAAALARLVRGELRGRRLRAMLLFVVVVALASTSLIAGLGGQTQAGDEWDAAFDEANGAHVTLDGDPEVMAEVASLPEVAASTHPYRRSAVELDLLVGGEPVTTTYVREMAADDLSEIARPLLRDGRWARPGAEDEVVIDRAFALEEGVAVGDEIAVGTPGGPRTLTVVGRAIDLVDCFYPNCGAVTAWVDPTGYQRLAVGSTEMVFLRLRAPYADDRFIAGLNDYPIGTQGWIDTRDDSVTVYEILGAFLGAFGVFVMIAAAVVVAGSMATRAVARRRDIGLLKAIGATPSQVAASIVLSHALAAAVGVVIGWVLGSFLTPFTAVGLGDTLGVRGAAFSPTSLATALIVVELIVVVTTVLPAWRAGRSSTTAALTAVVARPARGRLLGRATARLGTGPVGLAGVRDAFGRPARSAFTALALALAVVAVLASLGTQRTSDRIFADPTRTGDPEDVRVFPTGVGSDVIPAVLDGEPGVASWFTETTQDLALDDETFLGRAMGGDVGHAGFDVREGRMFARGGEAVAGWGLLNRLGLDVGDQVRVEASGRPIELTIVGWYREGEDTGEVLRFPLADLQGVDPAAEPDWAGVNLADGRDADTVAASLRRRLGGAARVEVATIEMSDEIQVFRLAFVLVSGLVVVMALANLASTMLLAVRERAHEFGVLRAVGVTPRQVVAMVAVGAAALAVVAALIGVPLGWAASAMVTEVVGVASGLGPGIGATPGAAAVLVVVPAAVVVAAVLGAVSARRAAAAEVSELVSYE
ncbi:MAG TPA: FtsX-like permease family protein [Acidimicrobiales bacterium]|nr:FtsX-like permease family protein [Acidimicrobiales bacterium]